MTSTGDAAFDSLVRSLTFGGGANTSITITNLTAGTQYQGVFQ
jgi:hypothetical protein